ncbi:MAG: hypothetical protein WKF37_07050 [Bryobacteraceae bacterium]
MSVYRDGSILGGRLADVAASPQSPDELLAAGEHGVWRSLDGGASWVGVAGNLPNLPVKRLVAVEDGISITAGDQQQEFIWRPGYPRDWQPSSSLLAAEYSCELLR